MYQIPYIDATSLSVFIQFILFITMGSLADHGPYRLKFMLGFGILTAVTGLGIIAVIDTSLWWLAFLIYIFGTTFFGAAWVFLYSFVPVLTRSSPAVLAAAKNPDITEQEYYHISDRTGNEISSKGFFAGYLSAVIQLVLASLAVLLMGSGEKWGLPSTYPMQICIAAICLWEIVIIFAYTSRLMKPRPGPNLPKGENYILFSLKNRNFNVTQFIIP